MRRGESLREYLEREGYPPAKVDEIVGDRHYQLLIKAKALKRWRIAFCVVCFLCMHSRAAVSANAPSRKRERGEF